MSCGCFPVAGDLESIREWITDGENGLLTDATDPHRLAESIVRALKSKELQKQAAVLNAKRIADGAEYNACMSQASLFYQRTIVNS
jgi:glycosyltransferase involved in cell wall biosynthesis